MSSIPSPGALWSGRLLTFFEELPRLRGVPKGIAVMNPYEAEESMRWVNQFYLKFYADDRPRTLMLGINPGRLGAGATGISFTDPIRLEGDCGIPNTLIKKPELSADFIYRMIHAYGGPRKFYRRYLISAVSPLGFTLGGKNINYYDDPKLERAVKPFAAACISKLVDLGVNKKRCYCIGEGKNLKFLDALNREHRWFEEIIPLPHPRFIMQYRRKQLDTYIRQYLDQLR
jgi:hypothetical protein